MSFKRKVLRNNYYNEYKKAKKEYKESISYKKGEDFMSFSEYIKECEIGGAGSENIKY